MYIVMITGSPHKNGTSALLADEFIKGAEESGHSVFRFNTAFECVHPCIGCDSCQCGDKPCVFQDDMNFLYPELKKADMIIFVSPLYYHCLSAQIKIAIDRFHGIDSALGSYHETVKYLGWNDSGVLLAYGCSTRADIEKTDYPKKAYELGRAVK